MKVLIACEESQTSCIAWREAGHEAYSCDIQPCSGGRPEWHIQGDVLPLLNGFCSFVCQDGSFHSVLSRWDIIIAHPPCIFLTKAGACNIPRDPSRIDKGFQAVDFFLKILHADCPRICVENPPPMSRFGLPPYDQLVRPYFFGDRNNKPICLWLVGLPVLVPSGSCLPDTDILFWTNKRTGARKSCSRWYNSCSRNHSVHRSKTFPGFARAMVEQWGHDQLLYLF